MATRSSPPPSPKSSSAKETGGSRKLRERVELDERRVFQLLKETGKEWDDVATDILRIKSKKCDEIRNNFPTNDDRLRESIRFWLKRCPLASYRWLANRDVYTGYVEQPPDALTIEKLRSALASFSERELVEILDSRGDSREELISNWRKISPFASWKWLASTCFADEKKNAVDEVKKHFERKLEPSLTVENICSVLKQVKDPFEVISSISPDSKMGEMVRLFRTLSQCQVLSEYLLDEHPAPSWELICFCLYGEGEYEALENVQNKYLKDGDGAATRTPNHSLKPGESESKCGSVVVESINDLKVDGSQGTAAATVPLKEFYNSHPDYKAMQIVCNETFEKLIERYLASSNRVLVGIKEKYMDEAFKGAKYSHSEVEVDLGSITEFDPIKKSVGGSATFTNNDDMESSKTFTQSVETTTGTELTEIITSGWSITGGLSAQYQGIGASTGVGYTKQRSEAMKKNQSKSEKKDMTDTFLVKPKHSRRATVIQTMQRKECKVRSVQLTFPKDAKLTCKFRTKDGSNKVEKSRFPVGEILDDYVEKKGDDPLIAKLEGKCIWVETDLKVNVEPDKPLK